MTKDSDKFETIVLISTPAGRYLDQRQLLAYRNLRENRIQWLTDTGTDPKNQEGYATATVKNYATIDDYSELHLYNIKLALKAYFRWRSDVDE